VKIKYSVLIILLSGKLCSGMTADERRSGAERMSISFLLNAIDKEPIQSQITVDHSQNAFLSSALNTKKRKRSTLECNLCKKEIPLFLDSAPLQTGINEHIKSNHKSNIDSIVCSHMGCGKKFVARGGSFSKHHQKAHRQDPKDCCTCSNWVENAKKLHEQLCQQCVPMSVSLICQMCQYAISVYQLRQHVTQVHDKGIRIECYHPSCGHETSCGNLYRHHIDKHGSSIIQCLHCQSRLVDQRDSTAKLCFPDVPSMKLRKVQF
jgi:hypothetical protein